MTKTDALRYAEELQSSSFDLVLFNDSLKQISDLCHRTDLHTEDVCKLMELLVKEHKRISEDVLKNALSISRFIGPEKTEQKHRSRKVIPLHPD